MAVISYRKRALILITGAALLMAVCIFSLPDLMIPDSDKLHRVDAIFHLSVETRSKADDYVLDLFQQEYAEQVVCLSSQISHELYPSDFARLNLITRGIPEERINSLHLAIYECPVELVDFLARYCLDHKWDSILIVTSPEGNRRGRQLMRDDFKQRGIELNFTHAPEDELELRRDWWRTHWKIQRLIGAVSDLLLDIYFGDCRQDS